MPDISWVDESYDPILNTILLEVLLSRYSSMFHLELRYYIVKRKLYFWVFNTFLYSGKKCNYSALSCKYFVLNWNPVVVVHGYLILFLKR